MKLSIVVPVYNVEKYVRKCILSIVEQDNDLFKDIELIVVNDGTKDHSIETIEDIFIKFPNIKYISQINQGLSMARNNGMQNAHGDYIWFIDSDDWIAPNALQILLPFLDGCNDTIVIGVTNVYENNKYDSNIFFSQIESMSGKESFKKGCQQLNTAQYSVYKRDFLIKNNLEFMPNVYHEDDEFCPRVSYLAKKISFLPYPLYYRRNEIRQSITSQPTPKRAFDSLEVAKSLIEFKNNIVVENEIKKCFDIFISVILNNAFEVIAVNDIESINHFNSVYKDNHILFNKCLANGEKKNRIESFLFQLFPNDVISVYRFLCKFKNK